MRGSAVAFLMFSTVLALPAAQAQQQPSALDQVVDRLSAREAQYVLAMRKYTPLVETYLQEMQPDPELGEVPKNDWYHLSRLSLTNQTVDITSFASGKDRKHAGRNLEKKNFFSRTADSMSTAARAFGISGSSGKYSYVAAGFDSMVLVDSTGLNRQRYDFKFVRREFLGELRTIVLDVTPKAEKTDRTRGKSVSWGVSGWKTLDTTLSA